MKRRHGVRRSRARGNPRFPRQLRRPRSGSETELDGFPGEILTRLSGCVEGIVLREAVHRRVQLCGS